MRQTALMRRWSSVIALSALIAAITPSAPASGSAATRVIYVAPVDANAQPLAGVSVSLDVRGKCEPGSDSVPGPVYRCFDVGNSILDPCWADHAEVGSVLCLEAPWSQTVVKLDTGIPLPPNNEPVPTSQSHPWGVRLASGETCLAAQGAHDRFRGRVVDYACGKRYRLVLLRGMHHSHEPWSFDSAIWTGTKYVAGRRQAVRVAWFGGPRAAG